MALSPAGVNLVILFVIFGVLGLTSVILRIYARHIKKTSLAFNDYAAIAALVHSYSPRRRFACQLNRDRFSVFLLAPVLLQVYFRLPMPHVAKDPCSGRPVWPWRT